MSVHNTQVSVNIDGRLTYRDAADFLMFIKQLSKANPLVITVELRELHFLDSSALSMIIVLNDVARLLGASISFYNPCGQVKRLFETACIYNLLDVHGVIETNPGNFYANNGTVDSPLESFELH